MKKVNLAEIKASERRSPKGKYQKFVKDVSIALGREPESLDLRKRHAFDVAEVRIPPGASYCPYHAHVGETEFYVVISGSGTVRDEFGKTKVTAGDAFIFHPHQAHQLSNDGPEDFVYYVIADNPVGDTCYYPDSGKWAVPARGGDVILKGDATDYYEGEE
jgi:Uncharacterized conserved protein, contains double-stranded beta-helix domain